VVRSPRVYAKGLFDRAPLHFLKRQDAAGRHRSRRALRIYRPWTVEGLGECSDLVPASRYPMARCHSPHHRLFTPRAIDDASREITKMQKRPGLERQHAVDAVLQFANISRPVVTHHRVHRVGCKGISAAPIRKGTVP